MADELQFNDRDQLEDWLKKQPVEWSHAIAARAALRVLPLIATGIGRKGWEERGRDLTLAVFRCTLISSGVARWWTPDDMAAAAAFAADAASSSSSAADAFAAASAAAAAAFAADAAASSSSSSAFAAAAASSSSSAFAAAADADAVWEAVSGDARWLLDRGDADAAEGLLAGNLWLIPGSMPKWARSNFKKLRDDPQIGGWGFKPWLDWYADLALDGRRWPRDVFGPDLSRRIATQPDEWWKRGAEAVNADIAQWLAEREGKPDLKRDIQAAGKEVPQQTDAPSRFGFRGEKLAATPIDDTAGDLDAARELLAELREKLADLDDRMGRSNSAPVVAKAVKRLLEALPEDAAELKPVTVLSRATSIETQAAAHASEEAEEELFPDAVGQLYDVAATTRMLLGCYPAAAAVEINSAQLGVNPDNAPKIRDDLDRVKEAADDSPVVDDSAKRALGDQAAEAAIPDAPVAEAKRVARYALTVRNFLTPVLRFAVASGFAREATGTMKEIWEKARPKFVDGAADGVGSMGKPLVVAGIAALVAATAGPTAGVAAAVVGFGRIDFFMKLAEKYLLRKFEELEKEAAEATKNDGSGGDSSAEAPNEAPDDSEAAD